MHHKVCKFLLESLPCIDQSRRIIVSKLTKFYHGVGHSFRIHQPTTIIDNKGPRDESALERKVFPTGRSVSFNIRPMICQVALLSRSTITAAETVGTPCVCIPWWDSMSSLQPNGLIQDSHTERNISVIWCNSECIPLLTGACHYRPRNSKHRLFHMRIWVI